MNLKMASYLGVIKSEVALEIRLQERINSHQRLDNRYAR